MTRLQKYEEIMKDDKNKNRAALKLAKLRAAEESELAGADIEFSGKLAGSQAFNPEDT